MARQKNKPIAGHMNPVQLVIHLFGGTYPLSRKLDLVSASTVYQWGRTKHKTIPSHQMIPILELAKKEGIALTADDLIYGRDVQV